MRVATLAVALAMSEEPLARLLPMGWARMEMVAGDTCMIEVDEEAKQPRESERQHRHPATKPRFDSCEQKCEYKVEPGLFRHLG